MLLEIDKLQAHAKEILTPKRYAHCVAVQKRAVFLAELYGVDLHKASIAGLLHDICHDMTLDEQLNYLTRCDILLDDLTLENPPVWHSMAGARYAEEVLGIDDREILLAIRYHTTGRAGMTMLEKVVYIADLTSSDRTFLDIEHVRALSEQSLDQAMRYSICFTVEKLVRRNNPLVRDAWEAYNDFVTSKQAQDARAQDTQHQRETVAAKEQAL